jgi:ubiquinone/menaquinone biosynthesis C-methylase UbiE
MLDISGDPYRHLAAAYDALGFSQPGLLCLQTILVNLSAPPKGKIALDVGCGTGKVAIALAKAGWKVTGFDLSPAMVSMARLNAMEAQVEVDFVRGDLLALNTQGKFNLITAFALTNFLRSPKELEQAFGQVARALAPSGAFAFDFLTPEQLAALPPSEARIVGSTYFLTLRQLKENSQANEQRLVWFRTKGGQYEKQETTLVERAWSLEEIEQALKLAKLALTDYWTLDDRALGLAATSERVPSRV